MVKSPILALAAGFAALLSVSCEFFGTDQFPSYLEYASARRSLSSLYASAGLSDPVYVGNLRFLRNSSGYERTFLYVSAYEGNRLFVLDGSSLETLAVIDNPYLSSFLAVAPGDNFICGGVELDPASLSIVNDTLPTSGYWSDTRAFSDGTDLYVINPAYPGFMLLAFDSAYSVSAAYGPGYSDGSSDSILSAHIDSSGAVRLLFGNWGTGTVLAFDTVVAAQSAFASSSASSYPLSSYSSASNSFPLNDQGGWLTDDGAVSLSHDNGSYLRRYPFGSSSEADRQRMDDTKGDRRQDFSADGTKRVLYDGGAGFVYLMRTWWK